MRYLDYLIKSHEDRKVKEVFLRKIIEIIKPIKKTSLEIEKKGYFY